MEWLVPIVLATAFVAPVAVRALGDRAGPTLALVPAGIALFAASRLPALARGETTHFSTPWVPSLGIDYALRLDGLSNLLVLLVAGIGALVVVYASGYLRGDPRLGRFYGFLLAFMAAMLGVVTADDLLLLFVFWEGTTITSYLLIGFEHEKEAARRAAKQSLLVTGAGGLALLAGLLLLASAAGTSSISGLAEQADAVRAHPHYPWILALIATGAFAKSAQFPLHFWLPAAMEAPTPVSAYLHSSTMVKAGVFLLARLSPVLGGTEAWYLTLGTIGAITLLLGAVFAVAQDDLKRILAYSTVAVLGLLTLLLGLGTPIAARAFAVTLLAHALYKGTLFLVAGNLYHVTGTRSVESLGGLRRAMPWTGLAAILASISMAGAPPLFGFLAKETALEAALEAPRGAWVFGTAAVGAGICLVAAALRVGFVPFAGAVPGTSTLRDPDPRLRVPPLLLAAAGVLAGALVGPAERLLVAPAATAILQDDVPTGLALWHGFTAILGLSACALLAGYALFRFREAALAPFEGLRGLARLGPGHVFAYAGSRLLDFAAWQARFLQNGSLLRYVAITLGTAFAAALYGLAAVDPALRLRDDAPFSIAGAAAVALVVIGSLLVASAATRLGALIALGAVGFGVALLFLIYSAPDLALTQLVVEVLTVVLFVYVVRRLPARASAPRVRRGDHPLALTLAAAGGLTMGTLTLLAARVTVTDPISTYFDAQSVPLGHGRNVVNVILVDFRALDTLGELTVLAVAALGILALLARGRRAAPEDAS